MDLISRQSVKELAHKQVREKYCGMALKKQRDFYIKLADSVIDLLPSSEPQIIRCKDCKWFNDVGCAIEIVDDSDRPTENDFCSFAERREVTE